MPFSFNKIIFISIIIIFTLTGNLSQAKAISIKVIHTNDHHSHLDGSLYDLVINNVPTRLQMGGFSRLVSVIEKERTKNTILLNTGEKPTGSYAAHIVAEAFRRVNPQIDFAIQNAGGVRTQFLEGEFTVGNAIKMLPFSNTVVLLKITGSEIRKVLNEAAFYSLNSGSTGAFPYAAGLRWDVRLSAGENRIITNIEMQDQQTGTWSALKNNKTYTVSTNSFTALGKDNYLTFKTIRDADPTKFENTHINYFIPLKEYIEQLPNQTLLPLNRETYCLKSVTE